MGRSHSSSWLCFRRYSTGIEISFHVAVVWSNDGKWKKIHATNTILDWAIQGLLRQSVKTDCWGKQILKANTKNLRGDVTPLPPPPLDPPCNMQEVIGFVLGHDDSQGLTLWAITRNTCYGWMCLIIYPLKLWVKLPAVDTIHPQSSIGCG